MQDTYPLQIRRPPTEYPCIGVWHSRAVECVDNLQGLLSLSGFFKFVDSDLSGCFLGVYSPVDDADGWGVG